MLQIIYSLKQNYHCAVWFLVFLSCLWRVNRLINPRYLIVWGFKDLSENHTGYSGGAKPSSSLLCSICSMLAWVGQWLLDDISPSIMVLSECFFQVQSLHIVLHNLFPSLAWSFPSCSTINHQTSTFANPVLSFHPFYVANPPVSHLPYGHRNVLYS